MKGLRFIAILTLLMVVIVSAAAKVKNQNLCNKMLFFSGEVIKNKETKQKEPVGEGKLHIVGDTEGRYNTFTREFAIEGIFEGDYVHDATFFIDRHTIYKGAISYTYKSDNKLLLKIVLSDGKIIGNTDGESIPNAVCVSPNQPITYTLAFFKNNQGKTIAQCAVSPEKLYFKAKGYPKDLNWAFRTQLSESSYEATLHYNYHGDLYDWSTEWRGGVLNNDMKIIPKDFGRWELSGENNTYLTCRDHIKFRLQLSDGAIVEWNRKEKNSKIRYPNGDTYVGTFSKMPFKYSYDDSDSQLLYKIYSTVPISKSSDFVLNDGKFTHSSGVTENVTRGEFVERENDKPYQFKQPAEYYDIVNHSFYCGRDGTIYHPNRTSSNNEWDLLQSLSKSPLDYASYVSGENWDELDKHVRLESDQYPKDVIAFNNMRTKTFYSIGSLNEIEFSTNGFTLEIRDCSADSELRLISFGHSPYFPINVKTYNVFSTYAEFPISDINILKKLKEAKGSLDLIVTYLPGTILATHNNLIAKPTGLYIYHSGTGEILCDLSRFLGKYDEGAILKKARALEAAEEVRRNTKPPYHNQARKIICTGCYGKGYQEGYNMGTYYHNRCPYCHGKGYEMTHYYYD